MSLRTQFIAVFVVGFVALSSFLALAMAVAEEFLLIEVPRGIDVGQVEVRPAVRGGSGEEFGSVRKSASGIRRPLSSRDQVRARSVKAVVYSPGCGFQTFAFDPIPVSPVRTRFECRPLAFIPLRGRIQGYATPQEMEVRVYYGAMWQMGFFGYVDGAVPQYQVATMTPDASGTFRVNVPDFANDPMANKTPAAGFWTINAYVHGDLVRLDSPQPNALLPIQTAYPSEIAFTVRP